MGYEGVGAGGCAEWLHVGMEIVHWEGGQGRDRAGTWSGVGSSGRCTAAGERLCRPVHSLSQRGVPLIEDAQFLVWCINITSAMLSILGEWERSH